MTLRQRLVTPLLLATLVAQALILGGNLYEQWVILPYWAEDPPRTTPFFRDILDTGHFDFYTLTPVAILAALLALGFAWPERRLRMPLGLGAAATAGILVITLVWAVPELKTIFPFRGRAAGPDDLRRAIHTLRVVSYWRWGVLLLGFGCSLRALVVAGGSAVASRTMIRAGSPSPVWTDPTAT